ncbi:PREDICTED: uncharacterized protein LOC105363709 [Ceratosolen solmsi marchali]|uniref:Uncharacterized protein LOC105363709 n=1 Tax=Ceratosolen solmsi marchali TaxID=326594 RepID=A0AAJ6YKI0_9HYME|nr:PREDICTED: uncharacterized protein LOC105363709 [Ceratosolen solmsi marchali]
MSESNSTSFFERHKFIFNNFQFKFKGLSTETEKLYIKLVKDLGAEVSNNATYILTDELNFSKNDQKVFTDLYNITYIIDSIQAGEPLDISLYRFKCSDNLEVDDNESINVINDIKTGRKMKLVVEKDTDVEMNDKASNVLITDKFVDNNQEAKRRRSDSDDFMSYTFENENINPTKTNVEVNNAKHTNHLDDSDSSISEIFNNSEEEEKQHNNDKKWWQQQQFSDDEICTIRSCSYQPDRHEKHDVPRRIMSMTEKKILLKYIIMTNSISEAKGRKIFNLMHDARYLVHRTVETLRNCLRRTILPNITSFGLPPHILNKFLELNKNNIEE